MATTPDLPREQALFYVDGDIDDAIYAAMTRCAEELASARSWTIAAPDFVDDTDDEAGTLSAGDVPIRTVGLALEQYVLRPPWGDQVPPQIERAMFEEMKAVVAALQAVSAQHHVDIGVELGDEVIGWIEDGVADRAIREGLLEAWERTLR